MRTGNRNRIFLAAAIILLTGTADCADHGLSPERAVSGVSGTVVFHGTWPAYTGEVRVALFTVSTPKEMSDLVTFSDPLPLFVPDAAYRIEVSPGTYGLVAVVWRSIAGTWDPSSAIGYYAGDTGDTLSVTVEDGKMTQNVDIDAYFSRAGSRLP